MALNKFYRCPEKSCGYSQLIEDDNELRCSNGHIFPFIPDSEIPIFNPHEQIANEYTHKQSAEFHDNSWNWVFKTFHSNEQDLRTCLVSKLALKPENKVLITGAGTGNDIPYIAMHLNNNGVIFAQDVSQQMLLEGLSRVGTVLDHNGIQVHYSVSNAENLPFENDYFDAAYHFGGINLFGNIQAGIFEMDRVVKPGGKILISDEGLAPWLKDTELGKMLINNNPLYDCKPPLHLIPQTANNVNLSWVLSHCFYVIDYQVSNKPSAVNLDVPHIGKRGGTVRSRYYGALEGIDPELKDKLYAQAEKQGISRVKYLEKILAEAVNNPALT